MDVDGLNPTEVAALKWRMVEPIIAEYLDEFEDTDRALPDVIARRNMLRNRLRVAVGRPAKTWTEASNQHRRKR